MIAQSDAFMQTGGAVEKKVEPGDTFSINWGLNSEEDTPVVVTLRATGEAADLVSFPESLELLPGEWNYFDIVVTIPEDHPTDVIIRADVFAKLKGDEGGATVFNIQMQKIIILTVGNPVNQEVAPAIAPPRSEDVQPEPTQQEQPEPTQEEQPEQTQQQKEPGLVMTTEETQEPTTTESAEEGGGCLISTATYGSEFAPQVQMLREIRDNSLLSTSSGLAFMTGFNTLYYSFSPTIADWERQSPVFQETVKIAITPLITSLSLLNYVDMDSEEKVLGFGIGIILLNIGMYFVAPAAIILRLKR